MSDLDLSAAIDAGMEARWPGISGAARDVARDIVAESLDAMLPLIVAQVRAQIAEDILAEVQRLNIDPAATSERIGLRLAARITRGES